MRTISIFHLFGINFLKHFLLSQIFAFILFSFPNLLILLKEVYESNILNFSVLFPFFHLSSPIYCAFEIWPWFNNNYWPSSRIQIFVIENKMCGEFSFRVTWTWSTLNKTIYYMLSRFFRFRFLPLQFTFSTILMNSVLYSQFASSAQAQPN